MLDDLITTKDDLRRDLLPLWIKIFTVIFLIFGIAMPGGLILGALGYSYNIALYGLTTTQPFSIIGLVVFALFVIKGVTAYGLWTEKPWAPMVATYDAVIGVVICVGVMIYINFLLPSDGTHVLSLRLELLFLIPYLIKMGNIKDQWLRASAR